MYKQDVTKRHESELHVYFLDEYGIGGGKHFLILIWLTARTHHLFNS